MHLEFVLKWTAPSVAIQFCATRGANRSENDAVNKGEIRLRPGANTSQRTRTYS